MVKPFLLVLAMLATGSGLLAANAGDVTVGDAGTVHATYLQTFDGSPLGPMPWTQVSQTALDVQVVSRDPSAWYQLDAMQAEHGPGCEPPSVTHAVSAYEDAVYQCNGHVMTALRADGYGALYLTPPALADWSSGEAVVRWDVSTFQRNTGGRDWWDVWVTPLNGSMAYPLEWDTPDGQGPPREAVHVRLGTEGQLCIDDYRGQQEVTPGMFEAGNTCQWWDHVQDFVAPSQTVRSTFELRIARDRVRISLINPDGSLLHTFDDYRPATPLAYDTGTVQFGHHSYNPFKDSAGGPGTWHWDNLSISPARPLTFVKADRRYVDGSGGVVSFGQPAPANAFLRFNAVGKVRVDGVAVAPVVPTLNPLQTSSYLVPIAAGKTSVAIGLARDSWYEGPFMARDFAVWSEGEAAPPTPTSTATPVPPTATPVPPTATPTPSPTATPTPSPTATPTPSPTATPTPVPVCESAYFRDGVLVRGPVMVCP